MFYQIFISPQVKRWATVTYKLGIYELPHELPNGVRLRILGNQEILGIIAQCPAPRQNKHPASTSKRAPKYSDQIPPTVHYPTRKLGLAPNILQPTVDSPAVNNASILNHPSRMNNTLQTKIKTFPHNLLKAQKHPRNENDTTFLLDQPLSSNQISTYISKKMLLSVSDYCNLPVVHSKYLIEFLA